MEPGPSPLKPFAWVQKRDGRLEPFEADKISQALFAAGESLGQPDPFLARELTDGILHFLTTEASGQTPTTALIAELIVKVVRELGQPALARAFAEGQTRKATLSSVPDPSAGKTPEKPGTLRHSRPAIVGPPWEELSHWVDAEPSPDWLVWQTAGACLREYSLTELFTRDLVSLHHDGLLTLGGLETPLELAAQVLSPPQPPTDRLIETVDDARRLVGELLAFDGLEYWLGPSGTDQATVAQFFRELRIGLRTSRLHAVLNLHTALPPVWAEEQAVGPLFTGATPSPEPISQAQRMDFLLEHALPSTGRSEPIRLDWHLSQDDFGSIPCARLERLVRRALEGAAIAFVFDRPRRPVALGQGLDRQHPAVLLTVALHLPRLAEQLGPQPEPSRFLQKLTSLGRLALSAATQKREFLRRHSRQRPGLTRGFLLDRARLVIVPVGLGAVTHALMGQGLCAAGAALDFARQVVQRLRQVVRQDAQAYLLDACLDAGADSPELAGNLADGVTAWDVEAPPRSQLRAAGQLHAGGGAGTVTILVNEDRPPKPEEAVDLLHQAWQQSEVGGLRFKCGAWQGRQLTAPWENPGS
jgi:hypothetical protein